MGPFKTYFAHVVLNPGTWQYKFIVNGNWHFDGSKPLVTDLRGNINNYVHVEGHPAEQPKKENLHQPSIKEQPKKENHHPSNKEQPKKENPQPSQKQQPKKDNPQPSQKQQNKGQQQNSQKQEQKKEQPQPSQKQQNKGQQQNSQKEKPKKETENSEVPKKGKPQNSQKEDPKKEKPQNSQKKDPKKEIQNFPFHLTVSYWEKITVNTVSGVEQWWQYVTKNENPENIPLRRRFPPECELCGNMCLVDDDSFKRYGVEWQPICVKCYATSQHVPLKKLEEPNPTEKPRNEKCYFCHEPNSVVAGDGCLNCWEYVTNLQKNFGICKTEAITNLYYYNSNLRKIRQ